MVLDSGIVQRLSSVLSKRTTLKQRVVEQTNFDRERVTRDSTRIALRELAACADATSAASALMRMEMR